MEGKFAEAEAHYRTALASKPGDSTALNSLGTLFQSQDKLDEAIALFRSALEARGDNTDARYNLANALTSKGKLWLDEWFITCMGFKESKYRFQRTSTWQKTRITRQLSIMKPERRMQGSLRFTF
jgi:tetratricopeptide (TPR) repeat protein